MRQLLLIALTSINAIALTHSKSMVSNQQKRFNWELKADVGSLFNKSLQIELGHRLTDKITIGAHGGYGQSADLALKFFSSKLKKKEKVVLDKDIYRVGLHAKVFSRSNRENNWFLGFYPSYERGSYHTIHKNSVSVEKNKELFQKGRYITVPVKLKSEPKGGKKEKDKSNKEEEPKTKKVWVEDQYITRRKLVIDDPDAKFGHNIKLPIRLGYQWAPKNGTLFSTSIEAGLHHSLTQNKSRPFINLNLLIGLAF